MGVSALRRQHGSVKWSDPRIDKLVSDLQPAPTHCPILHTELIYRDAGFNNPNCASLDKIIPERGYEVGNIAIISRRANTMKNDGTADEHDAIAQWIRERGVSHGGRCSWVKDGGLPANPEG